MRIGEKIRTLRIVILVGCFFLLMSCCPVIGAPYALLVGVSEYTYNRSANLEGPFNDVALLKKTLVDQLGVPETNIITLLNNQATKKAILEAIDRLAETTAPGDFIFVYFSGHGTSSFDLDNQWNMSPYTGALLTADFKSGGSHDEMMGRLLIGTRDLRLPLQRLEQSRRVLVAIDACFSGYAVRSLLPGERKYRFMEIAELLDVKGPEQYGSHQDNEMGYPYRNVVYLAASSANEKAEEVTSGMLRKKVRSTVDGLPHGAFTDYLVRGLQGEADTDKNRTLTIEEIYHYVRTHVSGNYSHTPQLLKPEEVAGETPIFTLLAVRSDQGGEESTGINDTTRPLKVAVQEENKMLVARLLSISGVQVVKEQPDVVIADIDAVEEEKPEGDGYTLILNNGVKLCQVADEGDLLIRIERILALRHLIAVDQRPQQYALGLELLTNQGVVPEGEVFGVSVEAAQQNHLLLLNIDPGGLVNIIYPFYEGELQPTTGFSLPELSKVTPPHFGTEYLVALAFAEKPPFWHEIPAVLAKRHGDSFLPDDPMVVRIVREATTANCVAGATITVKTAATGDIVKD